MTVGYQLLIYINLQSARGLQENRKGEEFSLTSDARLELSARASRLSFSPNQVLTHVGGRARRARRALVRVSYHPTRTSGQQVE